MREPPPLLPRPLLLLLLASLFGVADAHAAQQTSSANAAEQQQLQQLARDLRELGPIRANAGETGTAAASPQQELIDWLEQQNAHPGGIRTAERELRRALNEIHRDRTRELRRAEELLELIGKQRATLHAELSAYEITFPSALRRYQEFIPVPTAMEIMPLFAEPAELKSRTPADTPTPTLDGASDIPIGDLNAESSTDDQDIATLDANALLGRISADLMAIEHLLIMRDEESSSENRRHRHAMEKLASLVKTVTARARENVSRNSSSR